MIELPKTNLFREEVMNDKKSDVNWILYELRSNKNVELYRKGSAGIDEFKENLDDGKILLGAFRVTGVDKKGSVTSIRSKFVFVTWVGSKVTESKSVVGTAMSSIRTFFAGYNVFVDVLDGDVESLSVSKIESMLRSSGGAHQVQSYDWENKTEAKKKKKKRRAKKKLNADGEEIVDVPKKNPFRESVMKGLTDWCILELDTKTKSLSLKSEGKGGVKDVLDALNDDAIQYVGVRISGVDRQGSVVSQRSKFLYVTFVGSKVGVMQKALVGPFGKQIGRVFEGAQLCIATLDGDRKIFDTSSLEKALRAAAGSHQVIGYDFTNSKSVEEIIENAKKLAETRAAAAKASSVRRATPTSSTTTSAVSTKPKTMWKAPTRRATHKNPEDWAAVLSDSQSKIKWCTYNIDGKDIKLRARGDGGHAEFLESLSDSGICCGGFRVTGVDKSSVTSIRTKFIFVVFVGVKTSSKEKGSLGTNLQSILSKFSGYTMVLKEFNGDLTNLSKENLEAALRRSGGGHQVQSYDWENKTVVKKKKKKRRAKKKLNADGEEIVDVPKKNPFREGVMKGLTDWCILELDTKTKSLSLKSEGKGGVKDVVDALTDDAIQYVGVRISGVDRQGSVISQRSKFLYVTFVGSKVGVMQKALVGPFGKQIGRVFEGAQLCIATLDGDRKIFDTSSLEKALRAAAGSHQVIGYDFTNSKSVDEITGLAAFLE